VFERPNSFGTMQHHQRRRGGLKKAEQKVAIFTHTANFSQGRLLVLKIFILFSNYAFLTKNFSNKTDFPTTQNLLLFSPCHNATERCYKRSYGKWGSRIGVGDGTVEFLF